MLVRIVKLTFEFAEIDNFKALFNASKEKIRNFEGCLFLELYQDMHQENVFFTYSYWEDEAALNTYRKSPLFKEVWPATKVKFAASPEAWSVNKLASLK
ncbi:MAG: putative quinol monooxygenase [Mesonia hippocampi]|uniref:putative quinol monooxygenase n=1 Tax=Mesonia hippocampi TaxID=1628250 RepID=UPI003F9DED70